MKLRRFTPADIETIRLMASCGYLATAIAAKLGREPLAVRTKMVALGLPLRRRGKPKNGSRFMIPDRLWTEISVAAAKRNVKPTKLCHLALEAIARDKMWDAVIDAPLPKRKPVQSTLRRRSKKQLAIWLALQPQIRLRLPDHDS
jgi:hypothetical protein